MLFVWEGKDEYGEEHFGEIKLLQKKRASVSTDEKTNMLKKHRKIERKKERKKERMLLEEDESSEIENNLGVRGNISKLKL